MGKLTVLLLSILFLLPRVSSAEELNAGFVKGLWYSSAKVFAGEPVRVYVALRNHTDRDLTGTVRFNDGTKRIGVSYVSALPGRIVEAWVDWTPAYGEHAITATLSEVRLHELGESPETVEVVSMLAEDKLFVDYDTDTDDIGNKEDLDDDGDGLTDTDEVTNGTDPLVPAPKKTDGDEKIETEKGAEEADVPEEAQSNDDEDASTPQQEGLERYLGDGTVHDILSDVTEKVTTAKESVDTYRDARKGRLKEYFGDTPPSTDAGSTEEVITPSSSLGELATITRSRIEPEKKSFLVSVIGAGKAVIAGFYTLILWTVSKLLAHPAIVQLLLLLAIVYIVYRTARKFGRRPAGY